jgi:hypothetical protein
MATLKFTTPFTMTVTGSTGSGKTHWLYKLLKANALILDKEAQKILYCYGVWQDLFDDMEKSLNIEFSEGIPTTNKLKEFANGQHNIVVLDDLQDVVSKSVEAEQLFTRGSHHLNLSVIYVIQNLYQQGRSSRNIALNSHYTVLFKNPRDLTQITNLGRQLGMSELLKEAYKDATKEPYNPLLIDLSPHTDEAYKLRCHIFPGEDPIIYQE